MQPIPVRKDLKLKQFETWTQIIYMKQDGLAVDITDWTFTFIAKSKMSDVDGSAVITKTVTTHSDAANGETTIELTSTDTDVAVGNYYYQIEFTSDDSSRKVVMEGRITIEKNLQDS